MWDVDRTSQQITVPKATLRYWRHIGYAPSRSRSVAASSINAPMSSSGSKNSTTDEGRGVDADRDAVRAGAKLSSWTGCDLRTKPASTH
jgi:hypothetical protein